MALELPLWFLQLVSWAIVTLVITYSLCIVPSSFISKDIATMFKINVRFTVYCAFFQHILVHREFTHSFRRKTFFCTIKLQKAEALPMECFLQISQNQRGKNSFNFLELERTTVSEMHST